MAKLNTAQQLDVAIRQAAGDADSGATSTQIAEQFYEAERRLLEPFIPIWTIEKVAVLIGKYRAKSLRRGLRILQRKAFGRRRRNCIDGRPRTP